MGPNCVWSLCMAILPAIFIAVFILNIEWLFLTWSLDLWDELCVKITIFHRLLNDVPREWTAFWVNLVLKFQLRGGRGRFLFWKSGYISIGYSLHRQSEKSCMCFKTRCVKTCDFTVSKVSNFTKGFNYIVVC